MSDSDISIHNQFFEAAFQGVLDAESELSKAKSELDTATILFGNKKSAAEKKLADAWVIVEKMMEETGEFEVYLPEHKAKIGYSTPRRSVKIVDTAAVPDEYCKIERKPKLKEIGDLLKAGEKHNWASLEYGEKKLGYRLVKDQPKEKEDGE